MTSNSNTTTTTTTSAADALHDNDLHLCDAEVAPSENGSSPIREPEPLTEHAFPLVSPGTVVIPEGHFSPDANSGTGYSPNANANANANANVNNASAGAGASTHRFTSASLPPLSPLSPVSPAALGHALTSPPVAATTFTAVGRRSNPPSPSPLKTTSELVCPRSPFSSKTLGDALPRVPPVARSPRCTPVSSPLVGNGGGSPVGGVAPPSLAAKIAQHVDGMMAACEGISATTTPTSRPQTIAGDFDVEMSGDDGKTSTRGAPVSAYKKGSTSIQRIKEEPNDDDDVEVVHVGDDNEPEDELCDTTDGDGEGGESEGGDEEDECYMVDAYQPCDEELHSPAPAPAPAQSKRATNASPVYSHPNNSEGKGNALKSILKSSRNSRGFTPSPSTSPLSSLAGEDEDEDEDDEDEAPARVAAPRRRRARTRAHSNQKAVLYISEGAPTLYEYRGVNIHVLPQPQGLEDFFEIDPQPYHERPRPMFLLKELGNGLLKVSSYRGIGREWSMGIHKVCVSTKGKFSYVTLAGLQMIAEDDKKNEELRKNVIKFLKHADYFTPPTVTYSTEGAGAKGKGKGKGRGKSGSPSSARDPPLHTVTVNDLSPQHRDYERHSQVAAKQPRARYATPVTPPEESKDEGTTATKTKTKTTSTYFPSPATPVPSKSMASPSKVVTPATATAPTSCKTRVQVVPASPSYPFSPPSSYSSSSSPLSSPSAASPSKNATSATSPVSLKSTAMASPVADSPKSGVAASIPRPMAFPGKPSTKRVDADPPAVAAPPVTTPKRKMSDNNNNNNNNSGNGNEGYDDDDDNDNDRRKADGPGTKKLVVSKGGVPVAATIYPSASASSSMPARTTTGASVSVSASASASVSTRIRATAAETPSLPAPAHLPASPVVLTDIRTMVLLASAPKKSDDILQRLIVTHGGNTIVQYQVEIVPSGANLDEKQKQECTFKMEMTTPLNGAPGYLAAAIKDHFDACEGVTRGQFIMSVRLA